MRRKVIACLIGAILYISVGHPPSGKPLEEGKVITGQIQVAEVSGATLLPGDRLLFVSDEGNTVILLEDSTRRLMTGNVTIEDRDRLKLPSNVDLNDLEDVAWNRESDVYLVTSHSRNRRGKNSSKRYQIALLSLGDNGKPKEPVGLSAKLSEALSQNLRTTMERTPAQSGFNIEGAAVNDEGHLLLGVRSPTRTFEAERKNNVNEDAIVLLLKNPKKLFPPATGSVEMAQEITLDLNGRGIRGIHYNPEQKGYWILAGLSPDPNYSLKDDWALWFWDGKNSPKQAEVPQDVVGYLSNPEAVCQVMIQGQPHLLLIADGERSSRYVLFPLPKP